MICEISKKISNISNPWIRLLLWCGIGGFISWAVWHLFPDRFRYLPSFSLTNNSPWIGLLGGGIIVGVLTLCREFYIERKCHLASVNYVLQALESQKFILLGFKRDTKKGQEEIENFLKAEPSLERWRNLDYPLNSFPKQSVAGYKELVEKLIFIAPYEKFNNLIILLHDMAKLISELDHHIEYRNEKINQYYQQSIYGEGTTNKQFEEAKDREQRSIKQFLEELDNILVEIRRGLKVLRNFGKSYFFFSCKVEKPKIIPSLEDFMPPDPQQWIDKICPEK